MTDPKSLIQAAQYLRMSTEHQQYSPENQSTAIRTYAEGHGFTVVRTYADPAKSGLFLKNRRGLRLDTRCDRREHRLQSHFGL